MIFSLVLPNLLFGIEDSFDFDLLTVEMNITQLGIEVLNLRMVGNYTFIYFVSYFVNVALIISHY
jgi:hypothetical protein